jgi:hypothetical protein
MVERFNGRSRAGIDPAQLRKDLQPQHSEGALNHQTPIQALKKWQQEKPDLFAKRVYNQAGLDSYQPEFDFFKPSLLSLGNPDHHDRRNKREVIRRGG